MDTPQGSPKGPKQAPRQTPPRRLNGQLQPLCIGLFQTCP